MRTNGDITKVDNHAGRPYSPDSLGYRSTSNSPRIDRRVTSTVRPDFSAGLSVPITASAMSRKLSLQANVHPVQPVDPVSTEKNISPGSQSPVIASANTHSSSSNSHFNTLTVGHHRSMVPRKSVIGRQLLIERSSFQAQRLSDVGIAFGQQITSKIGLKLPASQERIVEQTRWLYLRYVFVRLRQNSLPLRDLNITKSSRSRSTATHTTTTSARLIAPEITCSAPATATATTCDLHELTQTKLARKRQTLSSSEHLSILTTKLWTLDQPSECTTESHKNIRNKPDSIRSGVADNSLPTRRYIMDPTINNQIFNVILNIIKELRDKKPDYYGDTIYELIGIDKFSSLESLLDVQRTICQEMTRSEISWCRISALFSLFGAMSLDCVRIGAPENVGPIADGFVDFVERDLALWISQQGGWESFSYRFRAGFRFRHWTSKLSAIAVPLLAWIIVSFLK